MFPLELMQASEKIGPINPLNAAHYLEPFFELSPDLLCIAGFDGYFKRINPAVSRLLGYSNEELAARPINEFIHPDDREITGRFRQELTKNQPLRDFENRYLTKNGEIVWLSWTSLPVEKDQLIFAIAKNITHKKKLEEERNSLLARLTQTNKDLKRLSYTTSHDLRSPVNNLLLVFDLLDTSGIADQETLELINMLKYSAENLKQMLDHQVSSVIQKAHMNEVIEEVSLPNALETVLASVSTLIQTSRATVEADFSKVDTVKFSRVYLESVFLNLVTNAIKYAKPGHAPLISITSARQNGLRQLVFSDNGLGFDLDKVKGKVFGFNQKFHNHVDSKGIGLYLVYNHVTSMGGQIEVESAVNVGTTFTISFPE